MNASREDLRAIRSLRSEVETACLDFMAELNALIIRVDREVRKKDLLDMEKREG